MWKKAPGGPVDTGEQPYNDINKIALRCFKGYFDFGAPICPGFLKKKRVFRSVIISSKSGWRRQKSF